MNTLRKIKLFLGLMTFNHSIDKWILTKNNTDPVDSLFWLNHGPESPNMEWPYLWKQRKLVYFERTLSGWKDYIVREAPVVLEVYSKED